MPAESNNPAFSMTVLPNLKALVMADGDNGHIYDNNPSDEEQVIDATEAYNLSNSAAVDQGELVIPFFITNSDVGEPKYGFFYIISVFFNW